MLLATKMSPDFMISRHATLATVITHVTLATCVATKLRDKFRRKLHSVTAPIYIYIGTL